MKFNDFKSVVPSIDKNQLGQFLGGLSVSTTAEQNPHSDTKCDRKNYKDTMDGSEKLGDDYTSGNYTLDC